MIECAVMSVTETHLKILRAETSLLSCWRLCFGGHYTAFIKVTSEKSDFTFPEQSTSAECGTKTPALHLLGELGSWCSLMFQSAV